jgi:hypothetical protein
MATYQGVFKPKNPQKYLGNPTNIIYRSRWELKFMMYLDSQQNVVQWASEEFCIPYRSPIDNRVHRYFPDFLVKKRTPENKIDVMVVEIKPMEQSRPPKPQSGKPTYEKCTTGGLILPNGKQRINIVKSADGNS